MNDFSRIIIQLVQITSWRINRMALVIILIYIFSNLGFGQKGATPLINNNSQLTTTSSIYAVIVGISDYQSPQIPDLHYADRDAQAFADWLLHSANMNVPIHNIQLLVNENATLGNFIAAVDKLIDDCKENDLVFIYFSGHGDVERKTINQPGFLLFSDSPPHTYFGGGALNINNFQEIISTLSIQNKCHVVIISDACHAGKLSGSEIGGAGATAANLAKQYANEIKIMSCQPNEFAIEGTEWGEGRGVFSYYLVKGLSGYADIDQNNQINLFELMRYLNDIVPQQASPHSQIPISIGDQQFTIAKVDTNHVDNYTSKIIAKTHVPEDINSKGFEEGLLSDTDKIAKKLFNDFLQAIVNHQLLEPIENNAYAHYLKLIKIEKFKSIYGLIRRNLAAALQNEVQQALNALLENDPREAVNWFNRPEKYHLYPRYLEIAMELIGKSHYLYKSLLGKKLYFEGYNLFRNASLLEENTLKRDSLILQARLKFNESIKYEPEAAYSYFGIGSIFFRNYPIHSDSLEFYNAMAIERSPGWLSPYYQTAFEYYAVSVNLSKAEYWINKAWKRDSVSWISLNYYSNLKAWQGKADESLEINYRMLRSRPDLNDENYKRILHTLIIMKGDFRAAEKIIQEHKDIINGMEEEDIYLATQLFLRTRQEKKLIDQCLRVIQSTTSTYHSKGLAYAGIVAAYIQLKKFDKANKYIQLSNLAGGGDQMSRTIIKQEEGKMYLALKRFSEAKRILEEALLIDPTDNPDWITIWSLLGDLAAKEGNDSISEYFFKKAITFRSILSEENVVRDEALFRYARFLVRQNRVEEAKNLMNELHGILPKSYYYGYGMALISSLENNYEEAFHWLGDSLKNYWPDKEAVLDEPLFSRLLERKEFKQMLNKYF